MTNVAKTTGVSVHELVDAALIFDDFILRNNADQQAQEDQRRALAKEHPDHLFVSGKALAFTRLLATVFGEARADVVGPSIESPDITPIEEVIPDPKFIVPLEGFLLTRQELEEVFSRDITQQDPRNEGEK